jgi:SAM-dependent methyltransferase
MPRSLENGGVTRILPDSPDSYYERVRHYSAERVAPFNAANRRCPQAREIERRLLIDRLDLRPGLVVLDTGSGGGYLIDGFPATVLQQATIICTDTAEYFVSSIPTPFLRVVCGMDALTLADQTADRVSNLAGLHHVERKAAFFAESYRILKPGGLVAVADVKLGTRPATWLNGPVDRMTDIGHQGMFVEAGEFSALLRNAGFSDVEERHEVYKWTFNCWVELVDFTRDLFRLTKASREEIEHAILDYLIVWRDGNSAAFEWELTYASGRK